MKLTQIASFLGSAVTLAAVSSLASTSPAHALTFNFSITNLSGSQAGTVTGEIVLPDTVGTVTNSASSIKISSAPGSLASLVSTQFVGGAFNASPNFFTYNATSMINTNFYSISTSNNYFGSNYLVLRLRNDPSFPLNFLAASTSNNQANVATGSTLTSPSVIRDYTTGGVVYSVNAAQVPFDIPGGATVPTVGGLLALGVMRKAKKRIASRNRIAHALSEKAS